MSAPDPVHAALQSALARSEAENAVLRAALASSSSTALPLTGRTALVTGSTSGIGLGIAVALARAGATVALNGLGDPAPALAAVAAAAAAASGAAPLLPPRHFACDLTDPAGCAQLVATVCAALGSLDILVNNAGMQHVAPLVAFPVQQWDAVLALNLSAPFHLMRAALPAMVGRGWGRVINIASVHGLVASAHKCAYVAAKHGLVGLTKAAALEHAAQGVTVNALCPGWVLTPLVQAQVQARAAAGSQSTEQATAALLAEKEPSGKFTATEDVGALAVFLASSAADNVMGAAWVCDGGWTAQ